MTTRPTQHPASNSESRERDQQWRTRIIEALLAALGLTDDTTDQEAAVLLDGCACNGEEGSLHLIWHLGQKAARVREAEEVVHLGRQVVLVAEGDGFTTEIRGVKIAQCDDRGRTEADLRAEAAEAEVARLRETVARVGALCVAAERNGLWGGVDPSDLRDALRGDS